MTQILNYGGGRQTAALCVLVAEGILPRPDRIVTADTSREVRSTWNYLVDHMQPYLDRHDLVVEIAGHELATVDLYGHNGNLLLPVYTETGKFNTYCSGEWKRDVVRRYLRQQGITSATNWIGFAFDERRRWNKPQRSGPWPSRYPLVELMVRSVDCETIVKRAGLPVPRKSRCWMCSHQSNEEWREVRESGEIEDAYQIDEAVREEDPEGAVFLHHSRVPLRVADLDAPDRREPDRQCGLGMCFV